MRMQQLLDALRSVVAQDLSDPQPIIRLFLTRNISGGWESWLQVSCAAALIYANLAADFLREVEYPREAVGGNARLPICDLWAKPTRGTEIWIELKTQRNSNYTQTINDFMRDIAKITALSQSWRQSNVTAAVALLILTQNDRKTLNDLRTQIRSGTLSYVLYINGEWRDFTQNILNAPTEYFTMIAFAPT
ncbi:hypothetical protein V7S57_01755 [Caulobacter sp. CCNWLY153]|uniref:hypothetical protein n=1 Tax=unclassified Caulobacter TaxID=2648921 RepID=UPI002FF003EA